MRYATFGLVFLGLWGVLLGLIGCGIDTHAKRPILTRSGTCNAQFVAEQSTLRALSAKLETEISQERMEPGLQPNSRSTALTLHRRCAEFKSKYAAGTCQFAGQTKSTSDFDSDCEMADRVLANADSAS